MVVSSVKPWDIPRNEIANGMARKTKSMKGLALMRNLATFSVVADGGFSASASCTSSSATTGSPYITLTALSYNRTDAEAEYSLAALTTSRNLGMFLSFSSKIAVRPTKSLAFLQFSLALTCPFFPNFLRHAMMMLRTNATRKTSRMAYHI